VAEVRAAEPIARARARARAKRVCDCTRVAPRRGLRASFTRSGRRRRHHRRATSRHPLSLCARSLALAHARASLITFLHRNCREKERDGRVTRQEEDRGGARGRGEGGGGQKKKRRRRGARAIQPEKSCRGRDEEGESARSNFIAWINRRDRSIDRSIALPRFFYHPSAVSADSRKRIVGR